MRGQYALSFVRVAGRQQVAAYRAAGCGQTPVQASAVPFANGYLIALSSSADFGSCGSPNAGGRSPDRIQLAAWRGAQTDPILLYEVEQAFPVKEIWVIAAGGGYWVIWTSHAGSSSGLGAQMLRLDVRAAPATDRRSLPIAPTAVAPLGRGFVVAGNDRVVLFNESGQPTDEHILEFPGPADAALSSPKSEKLLVAGHNRVTRYDCRR
jgi:hypothetical protein